MHLGVIGLGTGTLTAYGRPGDRVRYYEINPLVITIARTEFTYLKDCQAKLDVVLGDARLSLEREPPQNFSVLAAGTPRRSNPSDLLATHALRNARRALLREELTRGRDVDEPSLEDAIFSAPQAFMIFSTSPEP